MVLSDICTLHVIVERKITLDLLYTYIYVVYNTRSNLPVPVVYGEIERRKENTQVTSRNLHLVGAEIRSFFLKIRSSRK